MIRSGGLVNSWKTGKNDTLPDVLSMCVKDMRNLGQTEKDAQVRSKWRRKIEAKQVHLENGH